MNVRRIGGALAAFGVFLSMPLALSAQGTGTGLYGEYWNDRIGTGAPNATRLDPPQSPAAGTDPFDIDFAQAATPWPGGIDGDNNFVRWSGLIESPVSGDVVLLGNHDDGMRIWFDGRLVYDRWRDQGAGDGVGATLTGLVAGRRYSIRVEYYESGGGNIARLRWSYPGQALTAVQRRWLYPIVAPPRITPAGGTFAQSQVVTLRCDTVGATIHYTLDNTAPTTSSPVYTAPFVVAGNVTVRAIAVKSGMTNSAETSASFTISDTTPPRLLCPMTPFGNNEILVSFDEPVDLSSATWTLTGGLTVSGATQDPESTSAVLTLIGTLAEGTDYVLTASGVRDFASPANVSPPTARVLRYVSVQNNLAHYWKFNEGSGNVVTDFAGAAAGTVQNSGAVWIPGKYFRALEFNGLNNEILLVADLRTALLSGNMTLAAWVRTPMRPQVKTGAWPAPAIFAQDNGNNVDEAFFAWVHENGTIRATLPGGTASSTTALTDAAWTHVAVTRVQSSGALAVFVNGVQQGTATGNQITTVASAMNRLGVMQNQDGSARYDARWLGGMDEVRVYTAAMSASEIYNLLNEPPAVDAGPDLSGDVGQAVSINATVTDPTIPTGGGLTYQWTVVSQPAGSTASFGSPTAEDTTFTANVGGTYVLRLRASDGRLACSDDVTVILRFIRVTPTVLTTTEGGPDASFQIVLTVPPTDAVTISVASQDTTEGQLFDTSGNPLTQVQFTTTNWDQAQTVVVRPVDDPVRDGNVTYTVTVGPVTSTDSRFSGENPPDVTVTNNDNDTPGITVTPLNIVTSEDGGAATFTVALTSQPQGGNVTIPISSSNPGEGAVSTSSLTFTDTNWNSPQTVTVTGVDDTALDFTQSYTVVLGPATSADPDYNGMDGADVAAANLDNETIPDPDSAWGNCGATGAEGLLALIAVALWRRRARRA